MADDCDDCRFDPKDPAHLRKFYDLMSATLDASPGWPGRVIGGMCCVVLYPANEILDPDADTLQLHPQWVKRAVVGVPVAPTSLSDAQIEAFLPQVRHRPGMVGYACYSFGDVAAAIRAAIGMAGPAAPSLTDAARRVLAASEKATAGCAVPRWAGQENGRGEEFGAELDAALCALRDALRVDSSREVSDEGTANPGRMQQAPADV